MEDKLIDILQEYEFTINETESVDKIFRLFISREENGDIILLFIDRFKSNYPMMSVDINFMNVYETIKEINQKNKHEI